MLELRLCSALDKVFITGESILTPQAEGVMLQNEQFSFQAAFRLTHGEPHSLTARISVSAPPPLRPDVFEVVSVPCELPVLDGQRDFLRADAGFFPDALRPALDSCCRVVPGHWQSLWILADGCPEPGAYPVRVSVTAAGETAQAVFTLRVLPGRLPESNFYASQWLHGDCLARAHGVEIFSETWWEILEHYLKTASRFGLNTLLTPVFTPPLDTAVGTYRPACQLTDVTCRGGQYTFGFERLGRWIALARRCGFRRFELSHLFTQWGAKAAPQILARSGERLFGWDTPSDSLRYRNFLACFLPALRRYLCEIGVAEDCFLHISDEPEDENLPQYAACVRLLRETMPGVPILDAMGSFAVYEKSGIDVPVVSLDHMELFLQRGVHPLWGYYCWVQRGGVSNRFLSMPSACARVFGAQAYRYRLDGFLHWGFNFWNTFCSRAAVDPWRTTDADGAFPGGDAFSVYPYGDGCAPSVRLLVFSQALQERRALEGYERKFGREAALGLLRSHLGELTLTEYPRGAKPYLDLQRELTLALSEK